MDKAQFSQELVKALQQNEEKMLHISPKQLAGQAVQKLQFDFPDVSNKELKALSEEIMQWLKNQSQKINKPDNKNYDSNIETQQFPLQITPTVLTNLNLGAKNSKIADKSQIYKAICTQIYVGVVFYVLYNWDNFDSFLIIEKLFYNQGEENNNENFENFVEFEDNQDRHAEIQDQDDLDYEDMNINTNLDQNSNSNLNSSNNFKITQQIYEKYSNTEQKKQQFIYFCSFLDISCVQLQIFQQKNYQLFENQNRFENTYDFFSHSTIEKILSQLCKLQIFEPVFQFIQLLAEFRPILSENVLKSMEILDQFENGSLLTLQYLNQLFNSNLNTKILPLQWKNLNPSVLDFIEKIFSQCSQQNLQSIQSFDLIEKIYLCSQVLKFWVDECKQLYGSCTVAEKLIQSGITTNLVQLFIIFGDQPQFEKIWFSILVVISCGEKIVNWFSKVPKFSEQLNNQIFQYGEGEGGRYGLIWGLIFRKEKEIILNIIENAQNVENVDQDKTIYRQFLSVLRLLVVVKEISVDNFGETLKECEKQMRQKNKNGQSKLEEEVCVECLQYLKILNSIPGKND